MQASPSANWESKVTRQTEQLEREAEVARERLSEALGELRARMTPGQALGELIDYAREGKAAEFVAPLGRALRENLLPVALLGAGIAWLLATSGLRRTGRAVGKAKSAAGDGPAESGERETGVAGDTAGAAGSGSPRDAERVSGAAKSPSESASAQSGPGGPPAASDAAAKLADSVASAAGGGFSALSRKQPLLAAGLALLLGAAVGAAVAPTDSEDRADRKDGNRPSSGSSDEFAAKPSRSADEAGPRPAFGLFPETVGKRGAEAMSPRKSPVESMCEPEVATAGVARAGRHPASRD